MKETREAAMAAHENNLMELEKAATLIREKNKKEAQAWLEEQITKLKGPPQDLVPVDPVEEVKAKAEEEKRKKIQELKEQLKDFTGEEVNIGEPKKPVTNQQLLLQQLKSALEPKQNTDPQQDILRALTVESNKTTGTGGTTTLRSDILNPDTPMAMQDWLAQLNQQEEGEFLVSLKHHDGEGEHRGTKSKSGMLEKASCSIKQKQTWPQKNLGEDWANEELEFKQLRFEHMAAGETRTIETCTEPAQILGRLRLLRRIAYLKLRGFEWYMVRKMYAAILTSIETGELSWESNFDRLKPFSMVE